MNRLRTFIAAALAVVITLPTSPVYSNDGLLAVRVVDMTPDGTPDGASCSTVVRRSLACRGLSCDNVAQIETRVMSQARLRSHMPKLSDGTRDYLMWTNSLAAFTAIQSMLGHQPNDQRFDALVLFDCRPNLNELDIVIFQWSDEPAWGHMRHRHRSLTPAAIRDLSELGLHYISSSLNQ